MPDYAALAQKKTELIRKALDGSGFLAPISADPIVELTDASSQLVPLPDGWEDVGWLSNDGMQYGRDMSSSDVTSFGSNSPTRSDPTTDTTSVTVVCQETKMLTIGLTTGVDLSAAVPAVGGGVRVVKPTRAKTKFYRFLGLAVDDGDAGEIYIARDLPRVKPTSFAEQAMAGGDDPITWGVTLQAYKDSVLGYSEVYHFGGPGWAALLEEMGFQPAATTP